MRCNKHVYASCARFTPFSDCTRAASLALYTHKLAIKNWMYFSLLTRALFILLVYSFASQLRSSYLIS